jgi:hypothetical protein
MLLAEDEVYEGAKLTLRSMGWTILGGQPPNGNDAFPVVEIKDTGMKGKGSLGAYKPDLLACKGPTIIIVECKASHSKADEAKLKEVLEGGPRLAALMAELEQRNLLTRRHIETPPSGFRFAGALAYSGAFVSGPLGTVRITTWREPGSLDDPRSAYRLLGNISHEEPYRD